MPRLTLTERDGTRTELQCSQEIWKILSSSDTNGATKAMIIDALKASNKVEVSTESTESPSALSCHSNSQSVFSRDRESPSALCKSTSVLSHGHKSPSVSSAQSPVALSDESPSHESPSAIGVHAWTGKEEDVLVSARHDRDDDFRKSKNHTCLWKEVAKEVGTVTATQAMHKYNNLKKRWKEVIDSGTGTEAKYFRHREAFDQQYGTRSSTKPAFILDSASVNNEENVVKGNEIAKKPKEQVKEKKQQGKKRQYNEVIDLIEKQDERFTERVTKFHEEKMQRYDRFLDILEGKKGKDGNS